jgi:hypothetical protein
MHHLPAEAELNPTTAFEPAVSAEDASAFDLQDILDALIREIHREYKRYYGS